MRLLLLSCFLVLGGCGRYAEFTLPQLERTHETVRWQWDVRAEPVMARGAKGDWDSVDVLNPSVVQGPGGWWNLYSGYDGRAWHTGLAMSPDGLQWTRRGKVLSPDAQTWEGETTSRLTGPCWRMERRTRTGIRAGGCRASALQPRATVFDGRRTALRC